MPNKSPEEKLLQEWNTFKEKNDERIKALEEGDTARAKELDNQLEKVNDRLDSLEMKIKQDGGTDPEVEQNPLDNERKMLDAFIRNDPESESSMKAFAEDARQGYVPESVKEFVKEGYSHRFGYDVKSLPENLKTYGRNLQKKALSTDSLADGGVFSLPNFEMEVIKGIRELSPVRQVARVRNIGSGDALTTTVRDTTISSQQAGERENVSDTGTSTYKQVRIQTHERAASPAITRQEVEDSFIDIVADVQQDGQEEFAVQEGTDFISGDGVDQPEGILTNTNVSKTKSGSTTDFDFDDLMDLQASLKEGYNGVFMFSRQTRAYIRKLKDANNQYLWSPNVAAGDPNTILGDQYFLAPDLVDPSSGSFSDGDAPVLYGDFQRGYYIVDRLGLDVLRDPFSNRPFIEIYMRRRYGGQVVLPEAIKKLTTET